MSRRRSWCGWSGCRLRVAVVLLRATQQKLVLAPEYGGEAGRRSGCARRSEALSRCSPATGRPTTSSSTTDISSRLPTGAARSSHSTGRGTAHRSPKAATTWCSSRSRTARPPGTYVVFADGFAGAVKNRVKAAHRPSGLAVGPDGALYIADDRADASGGSHTGRYRRRRGSRPPPPSPRADTSAAGPRWAARRHPSGRWLRGGRHPADSPRGNARAGRARRAVSTTAKWRRAVRRVPRTDAEGTPLGPDLTSGKWLWGDGSLPSITQMITNGVPNPKEYRAAMPPMGGAQLSPSEVSAVAAYVWALADQSGHSPAP